MRAAERRCALRGRGCTSHHMCSSVNSKSACSRFAVPEENRRRAPATRKQASTHGPARPKAQPRAIAQAQRHALSSQSRFPVDLPRSQSQSTPATPPPRNASAHRRVVSYAWCAPLCNSRYNCEYARGGFSAKHPAGLWQAGGMRWRSSECPPPRAINCARFDLAKREAQWSGENRARPHPRT